jgi:hypothetical protein
LSEQGADSEKFSRSLYYLSKSAEYYDILRRNPETLERSKSVDLAPSNTKKILYPKIEGDLLIYSGLPRDLKDYFYKTITSPGEIGE